MATVGERQYSQSHYVHGLFVDEVLAGRREVSRAVLGDVHLAVGQSPIIIHSSKNRRRSVAVAPAEVYRLTTTLSIGRRWTK